MKFLQKKNICSIFIIIVSFSIVATAKLTFTKGIISSESNLSQNKTDTERVTIKQGDILTSTLNNTRLSSKDSIEITKQLKKLLNVNHCMPGDFYEILYDSKTGEWKYFRYYPPGVSYYLITKISNNNRMKIEKKELATVIKKHKAQGTIYSSLWVAMTSQNIPLKIIHSFADIFAWKIDFLTDTKEGDSFRIIYEIEEINKKNTKLPLKIIAAQYKTSSKIYNAFYFKSKNSKKGSYFNENGKSLKSAFLKSPLQFRIITSYFTTSRFHPILKYSRPHLGIDYAAPKGTPVSTVGDGVIIKAEYNKGGFGNLVIIRHTNGYETYYGHLSKYGKGIKKGARVTQGQTIGYVGSTGLATGPHLDFRIKHSGKFFNFLKMKHPPQTILTNEDKKKLKEKVQAFLNEFEKQ
ncbi:MAG: peptidoglycan DD-metalloendopeptidase family protein [Endomicrobiia bacterium]|nr:MAG: peptidoglycan DD-metalloendopeptidase family protein [Endomicrobiia bacterium]